ncbi:MAG: G5 domain-containing protein [Anaerolineae bacterium]
MRNRWPALLLLLGLVACAPSTDTCTVTLVVDGARRVITTEALTVRDLLTEGRVTLGAEDRVTPSEPTLIRDGMTVRVIRVETRTEKEEREIPFDRRTVHDTSIPEGETQLLEPGVTGSEELTYRITLEDGVEADRRLVRRATVREPRTEVILLGTRAEQKPIPISGTVAYIANRNAWIMRRSSANQRRLTHEGDLDGRVFALSADGSHLLYTRAPTGTEASPLVNTLWIFDTAAVDAEPVRLEVDNVLWAGWEPNCDVTLTGTGCRIAFATGVTAEGNPGWQANNDLWVARPRPSTGEMYAERQVLDPSGGGSYGWWGTTYAWGPDGQHLAYARADQVGVVRADDGELTCLVEFPPYRTYAPWAWVPTVDWSSEGEFIITTLHGPAPTGETPEESPVFDVWALAADGTITAELASEVGMWSAPVFAPKGELIAFGRARSPYASQTSNYDLYTMDRDGSDRQLIFPPGEEIGLAYPEIAWGADGGRLLTVYRENLTLIEIPEGNVYQLTEDGGVSAVQWHE